MNKGCYYTAQGQFVCEVEKAKALRESFRGYGGIEHFENHATAEDFEPGPEVKVNPWKLPDPPAGSGFTSFKKSCRMSDLNANGIKAGKCTVTGCVSTAKPPYCMLNCPACAIDDDELVNDTWDKANKKVVAVNDYCSKKGADNGGNCSLSAGDPAKKIVIRAEKDANNKDVYVAKDVIVNYKGHLYTLEEAMVEKKKDDVAARAQSAADRAQVAGERS